MKTAHLIPAILLLAVALLFTACKVPELPNPPIVPKPPTAHPLLLVDAATASHEYPCEYADTPITIDGKANEPAWKRAPVIDRFVMPWLGQDKQPKNATRAKVLWDAENFYFFADMDDPDLVTKPTEHNGKVWENDTFEVFLKPATDKPPYYEFEVNADNVRFDMFFSERGKTGFPAMNNDHAFKFDTAVVLRGAIGKHTDGGGWSVEGRLRWADFHMTGGAPKPNDTWRFSLCRVDYTTPDGKNELSTISPLTKPAFHRHEEYATLRFATRPTRDPQPAPPAAKPPDSSGGKRAETSPTNDRPYGIDQRIPWHNTKLVGFPEPPPRYHVERAFPNLKIKQPVYAIEEPGADDLLVVQHLGSWAGPGKVLRIRNDNATTSSDTVLELNDLVYSLCFHPDYAKNGYVYTLSNGPVGDKSPNNHVLRWTMDRATGKIDPKSKLTIIEWPSNGHNGGGIDFGPDGLLYFATGDTTSDSDRGNRGQDLRHLSSAMIRIGVDHADAGKNYGIPKDNPFLNTPDVRPEIWAHGFRNPWRQCFDKKTGALWVGQNGQDLWEQLYVVHPGENYGWPVYEGSHPFHPHRPLEKRTKYTLPILEHHHSQARSITGGVVYYGAKFPELDGCYIYGDFSTGRIWAAKYDGRQVTWHQEIAKTTCQITNFYADKRGELFVCDEAGDLYKLAPNPKDQTPASFPRLLSQTGLFTDTAAHQVDPGLIPYDVNSPLWSDGAQKLRYLAVPADKSIEYTPKGGWNFPDGAALVKTFALELQPGNSTSRRRLETRVMLKQLGQWTGYTYVWNDAQTDAELAPEQGLDQTFTVNDPAGERRQTWHYPSRAECLVCHSRAANFALGLSDLQMNRNYAYDPDRTDNQIRALAHIGVLKVDTTMLTPGRPVLPHPQDDSASLNARARSYLHANCAHCHVEAGGGNASVDLDFLTDPANAKMFDAPAQSNPLDTPDARLIATGKPALSTLYHRMSVRGPGQMPPMGSNIVDASAVKLIHDWIEKMPASTQPSR